MGMSLVLIIGGFVLLLAVVGIIVGLVFLILGLTKKK